MKRYFITGKVIPERANVSISPIGFNLIYETSQGKKPITLSVSIQLSQVAIIVDTENPIEDFYTLKNYLQNTLDLILDIFGYLSGRGYGSEITSLLSEDTQNHIIFGVGIKQLEKEEERPMGYDQIIKLFKGNYALENPLRLALLNFKLGIRYSADTAFYSYRAIEAIRKAFGEGNAGWELMHSTLSSDRAWMDELKESHADQQRHGGSTFMSGEEREEMLANTQIIIDKFLVYLSKNSMSEELRFQI